jgi:hypothetical protein
MFPPGAPPRDIPPMLRVRMYLGGVGAQIGWLIFAFGSIFFWTFAWHADLSGCRFREGKVARVTGELLNCRATHYSSGGSDDSAGTPIYANEYHYQVSGASIGGVSYDTGNCAQSAMTVEYLIAAPEVSRIEGMRRDVLSGWCALVTLLPAAGLALIVGGWQRGVLRVKLLREGVSAQGRVTGKIATASETMGCTDYRVAVAFVARDGVERQVTMRTNRPEKLAAPACSMVLYDPTDPQRALPVADFPGELSLSAAPRRFLVLPAVSVALNAWLMWKNW